MIAHVMLHALREEAEGCLEGWLPDSINVIDES